MRKLLVSLALVFLCAICPIVYSKPVALIDPSVELANPQLIARGHINIAGTVCVAFHVTGRNEAHYLVVLDADNDPMLVFAVLDPTQQLDDKNLFLVWSSFDVEDDKEV